MSVSNGAHTFSLIDNPDSGSIAPLFNVIVILQSVFGEPLGRKQTQSAATLLRILEMDSAYRRLSRVRIHPFLDVDSRGRGHAG